MLMQCRSCKAEIPLGARYCPMCEKEVSATISDTNAPSPSPTIETFIPDTQPANPTTGTNSSSQGLPLFPFPRRISRTGILISVIAFVLVLVGSSILIMLSLGAKSNIQRSTLLQNPYPPHIGTLVLNNQLSENNNGYYYWDPTPYSDGSGGCEFIGGAYHVTMVQKGYEARCLATGNFTDFAYQVQMTFVKGDGGGIIFRTDAVTNDNFYYFYIGKVGKYALLVHNSKGYVKILLSGSSSAFHIGLNQTNLIAVVALKSHIDLYVNKQHVTSVSDNTYSQGQIGVAADDLVNPTEVVFRNAKVWVMMPTPAQISATATASFAAVTAAAATATAVMTTPQNPYTSPEGTLALNDPLSSNNKGYNWDESVLSDGSSSCKFTDGTYHITMLQSGYVNHCTALNTNFSSFAYQVQMTIVKGDIGGVIFRADATGENFYAFNISRLGEYSLDIFKNNNYVKTLSSGFSSAFHTGLNQANLIAVVARGNTIDLYVNLQHIASVSDSTYSRGQIGVYAEDGVNATEVVFSNAKVWKL